MRVKEFIEEKLESTGLRKSQLAKKLGISAQHLNYLLRKKYALLPPVIALKLGKVFNTDPADIMLLSCRDMLEKAEKEVTYHDDVQIVERPFVIKHMDTILKRRREGVSFNKIAEEIGAKTGSSIYITVKRYEEKYGKDYLTKEEA